MSTFVLNREYALQMPTNYVEIDRDEMEYVDGGGTLSLTVTAGFAAGLVARFGTGAALSVAFAGLNASLAAAFVFGTAGWGTIFAATIVAGLTAVTPLIVSAIVAKTVNGIYKGNGVTVNVLSGSAIPNFNVRI